MLFLQCLKRSSSEIRICLIFSISYTIQKIFKNKYSFFNSVHNILDLVCTNFDYCAQMDVECSIRKIN